MRDEESRSYWRAVQWRRFRTRSVLIIAALSLAVFFAARAVLV